MWRRRCLPAGSPRKPLNLITRGPLAGAGSPGSAWDATVGVMPRLPWCGRDSTRRECPQTPVAPGDRGTGGQRSSAGLGCRVVRDGRDVVEAVRLPQGEQALGFGGEGVYPRCGPCLAAEDAVVVAPRADL